MALVLALISGQTQHLGPSQRISTIDVDGSGKTTGFAPQNGHGSGTGFGFITSPSA
jgi:hypothetical protein